MRIVRYTDDELIRMLRDGDSDGLKHIHNYHMEYCINFMKSRYDDHEEVRDIFQDVMLILYEKVQDLTFSLNTNTSLRTYLTSICFNQILIRLKKSGRLSRNSSLIEDFEEFSQPLSVPKNIDIEQQESDDFLKIINKLDEPIGHDMRRINILREVFTEMRVNSLKCYDILERFWFKKISMEAIASELGYKNQRTMINLKARCQRKMKLELFKRLGNA